jgi:hypothetical protein
MDPFEEYYHRRADIADKVEDLGHTHDALILAATAFDAIAAAWARQFPADQKEPGVGNISEAIRAARLMKRFAPRTPHAGRIAVICFAEDWKRHGNGGADAEQLLARRVTKPPELPGSDGDVLIDTLIAECPLIDSTPELRSLVEEYEYPALFYRFYRSARAHNGQGAWRTHQFVRPDEVSYLPWRRPVMSIGIGTKVVTRWVREVASGYAEACKAAGREAADDVDPGASGEELIKGRWARRGKTR